MFQGPIPNEFSSSWLDVALDNIIARNWIPDLFHLLISTVLSAHILKYFPCGESKISLELIIVKP